ncbi:MAG: MFS transporter [Deltaproteobacteria bacterium]|jgi:sugar phosphate permease|nr:MFS transporter [Deltaproteobacteria bacterium]MBW2327076.1 MFS transporter [Deltaproteobacteria bacterium]
MNNHSPYPYRDPHRWMVFSVICLVYFFVYFHRVSTSVIVSDLLEAFQTNATALGFMSSMYFYIYAFEQPLVGYLSDRLGPRRVIGYWSMAAAAGCFLFGMAPNIGWASVGRALIGLGVGGVYVPAVKAISLWFRKNEFATMIGLLMSMGNFGAVIATTPLAWTAATWGWRKTFFLIGGITLGLAFVTLLFTRDYARPSEPVQVNPVSASGSNPGSRAKVAKVLASGRFWIIAMIFFGIYGTLITLQGLWATPFLMTVLGIERIFASKLNMLIPVGVIIGAPFFGWLTDQFSLNKENTLIAILTVYTLTWVGIIFFFSQLGTAGLSMMLLVMGIATGGFISTLWGIVQETTPSEILGLISGMLNPAPFLGVAVFQVLTGAILDRTSRVGDLYPLSGFRNAFLICLFGIVICLVLSFYLPKSKGPEAS